MKFKIKFIQTVQGEEAAEAIIEADSLDEAWLKFLGRDFKKYLVVASNVVRAPDEMEVREIIQLGEDRDPRR